MMGNIAFSEREKSPEPRFINLTLCQINNKTWSDIMWHHYALCVSIHIKLRTLHLMITWKLKCCKSAWLPWHYPWIWKMSRVFNHTAGQNKLEQLTSVYNLLTNDGSMIDPTFFSRKRNLLVALFISTITVLLEYLTVLIEYIDFV